MSARPTDWHDVFGIDDPTPGDTLAVDAIARRWSRVADAASYAHQRLQGLLGDAAVATWIGQAGDAFRTKTTDLPDQLRKTADSYRLASEALTWWKGQLGTHQNDADRALVQGREAQADLRSARAHLSACGNGVASASGASALTYSGSPGAAGAPTPDQISAATQRLHAAEAARSAAEGMVDDAEGRLQAARRLAEDAGSLRAQDGRTAASRVHAAADAGISPRSFWDKVGDAVGAAWHVIVQVAKVVVVVLGVIALIIGGPIAWIVFAAALIVLADTLMRYAQGKATLLDVGLALLSCIPGTKGLTTLGELSAAFKAGGAGAAALHLGGALRTAGVNVVRMAQRFREGAVPAVAAIFSVKGMSTVVGDVRAARGVERVTAFFRGVENLRSGAVESAWAGHIAEVGKVDPARAARLWQGRANYPGVDAWRADVLAPGSRVEALTPGHLSGFVTPDGTIAGVGHDAGAYSAGVQIAPDSKFTPPLRSQALTFHANEPIQVASASTAANPHFGPGGLPQHYIPGIEGHLANGSVSVIGAGGHQVPVTVAPDGGVSLHLGPGDAITLTNPFPAPGVSTVQQFAPHVWHAHDVAPWAATPWRLDEARQ